MNSDFKGLPLVTNLDPISWKILTHPWITSFRPRLRNLQVFWSQNYLSVFKVILFSDFGLQRKEISIAGNNIFNFSLIKPHYSARQIHHSVIASEIESAFSHVFYRLTFALKIFTFSNFCVSSRSSRKARRIQPNKSVIFIEINIWFSKN